MSVDLYLQGSEDLKLIGDRYCRSMHNGVDSNVEIEQPESELRDGLKRRLQARAIVSGSMRFVAVPAMIDEYVEICETTFAAIGSQFNEEQSIKLRSILAEQLDKAFKASPRSEILITYESPIGRMVNYTVKPQWFSLEEAYANWVATREPPYFGVHPDARVMDIAAEAPDPGNYRILDLGAGTGRNSLALARLGYCVDAVEITEKFAEVIRDEAAKESLDIKVIRKDVFASLFELRRDYNLIILSEVVSDFRTTTQLRHIFELADTCLVPGGQLLFNAFIPRADFTPDTAARQMGQQTYSSIFTYPELGLSAAALRLTLVADHSVHDYERAHLPQEAWPPTSWYTNWIQGLDVFELESGKSPIEFRWLLYRKAN
jgi:2-polyprenyl-3-methyl-5-hydroxy-6-metoxy-1,4-benzoquinol methylase